MTNDDKSGDDGSARTEASSPRSAIGAPPKSRGDALRGVFVTIGALRFPLLIGAAAFILFAAPEQMRELYVVSVQDADAFFAELLADADADADPATGGSISVTVVVQALGGLFIFVAAYFCMLALTRFADFEIKRALSNNLHASAHLRRAFGSALASAASLAPLAGLLAGLLLAWWRQPAASDLDGPFLVASVAVGLVFVGLLRLSVRFVRDVMSDDDYWSHEALREVPSPRSLTRDPIVFVLVFVAVAVLFFEIEDWARTGGDLDLSFADFWVSYARALGAATATFLFVGFLTIALHHLNRAYLLGGPPYLNLFLSLAAASLFLTVLASGYTETKAGRFMARTPDIGAPAEAPTLAAAFDAWLAARPQRSDGAPYPAFFVAAEGGGMYAAAHAGAALALLQDACPRFADHVFVVSGVSGGSLGAATFAAAVANQAGTSDAASRAATACGATFDAEGPTFAQIRAFMDDDFIAPLTASLLAVDMPKAALWTALDLAFFILETVAQQAGGSLFDALPEWSDRSATLERSFEASWRGAAAGGPSADFLAAPIAEVWSPDGSAPALALNAMRVGSGRLEPIAPFDLSAATPSAGLGARIPIGVSTAVALSARFPWVTPPGVVDAGGDGRLQLLDGGYYDNSGVTAALRMIDALEAAAEDGRIARRFEPILLILSATSEANETLSGVVAAPIVALDSSRRQKGFEAQDAARARLCRARRGVDCDPLEQIETSPVLFHRLSLDDYPVPLGWRLSRPSLRHIYDTLHTPDGCADRSAAEHVEQNARNCFFHAVVERLSVD